MPLELECYILLFFSGAVLGWIMEVACKLVQFGRFINRGFLIGPWCPIYGFGAVLVTLLLSGFSASPPAVFVLAMAVCGTLEYLTSVVMEKLFHARWWDYSQKKFNLNGRVCADTLIPFGLLGLGMVYVAKPLLFGLFAKIPEQVRTILCVSLLVLLALDTVVSAFVLGKIRKTASDAPGDSTEEITRSVRQALARESALMRRTLRAFPFARLYNAPLAKRLKERRLRMKREMQENRRRMLEEIDARERVLRADLDALKNRKRKPSDPDHPQDHGDTRRS